MPQNPDSANIAVLNGARVPITLNDDGSVPVTAVDGAITGIASSAAYNLAASTAVKGAAGKLAVVNVIVAGSAPGAVHDCATVGAAAAGNKIFNVPNTVGIYVLNWPCATGITYVVGTGQTVAISYT